MLNLLAAAVVATFLLRGELTPAPAARPRRRCWRRPLRFLDDAVVQAAGVFPAGRRPQRPEPSILDRPRIVDDMRSGRVG